MKITVARVFAFINSRIASINIHRIINWNLTLKHDSSDGSVFTSSSKGHGFNSRWIQWDVLQDCAQMMRILVTDNQCLGMMYPRDLWVISPWGYAPNQEPALELHSRTVPSVEAHHHVNSPDTGRNSDLSLPNSCFSKIYAIVYPPSPTLWCHFINTYP